MAPEVGGRKFPYTAKGEAAAKKAPGKAGVPVKKAGPNAKKK